MIIFAWLNIWCFLLKWRLKSLNGTREFPPLCCLSWIARIASSWNAVHLTVQLKSNVVDQNNVDWNQNVSYLHAIVGDHQADLLFYPDSFITHLVSVTRGVMTRCAIDVKRYRSFFDDFILFLDDVDKSINRQIGLKRMLAENRTINVTWPIRYSSLTQYSMEFWTEKNVGEQSVSVLAWSAEKERKRKKNKLGDSKNRPNL